MNLSAAMSNSQLLRSQVYEYLRTQLRLENLKPGTFISMNQLLKNLGLGRTPVRDALLQLEVEGFVIFLPQRGLLIRELTREDIDNLYEMLGALDSRVLLSVFNRIEPGHILRMKEINEEMIATDCSQGCGDYFNRNTEFHNVYLNLSRNREILNQLTIIRQRLFQFGKKDWGNILKLNYDEHLVMIDLIERGLAKEAADFMRDVHCVIDFPLNK
ncbi:MAG: GntR family transcriptional regulator [Thermodesulfobacteriota bacterium]